MNDEPKDIKVLRALPIYQPGQDQLLATYHSPDSIMFFRDSEGNAWRPVKTATGWKKSSMPL
jgi:hypothetical protein